MNCTAADDDYFCGSHGDDAIFGGTLIKDTTSVTGAGACLSTCHR